MPAKENLPSDFDWVSARAACSPLNVFNQLKADAQRNTAVREEMSKTSGEPLGLQFFDNGDSFGVSRRQNFAGEIGVSFRLRDGQIEVRSQGVQVSFTADLTLNDDCECRLVVDGVELDRWQVLRRALDGLFFRIQR